MKKYKIIIILAVVVIISAFGITKFLNRNVRNYEFNTIILSDDNESSLSSDDEKDLDSLFHKKICSDYKVAWETYDLNKRKFKILDLNYFSGKLLIFYFNESQKNKSIPKNYPADKVFEWNFYEVRKDNKIIGKITYTEKDTLMQWIYDKNKEILTDEKGLVYKKIILN
jgi:hypothetical protein